MEPSQANARKLDTVPTKEVPTMGLLGTQINQITNVPEGDSYKTNNNPKINQGYELVSKPGNLGGGLIDTKKDEAIVKAALKDAKDQYKFIPSDLIATANRKHDRYNLEAFPPGETGTLTRPRPDSIPINKHGLEVYNIDGVTPDMIAADSLHHSQFAHDTRDILHGSLSDKQKDYLRNISQDYKSSLNDEKLGEEASMRNGVDAALRGHAVNQWPKEVNDGMEYTPQQKALLDNLKSYMVTGKH